MESKFFSFFFWRKIHFMSFVTIVNYKFKLFKIIQNTSVDTKIKVNCLNILLIEFHHKSDDVSANMAKFRKQIWFSGIIL